ncbi:META domain-containing protein, partial [Leyella stercorea]|uniref:META domain-containing protein n=1 Tax=Leyella stercorea TaxID=363265 RepID=UPI00258ACFBF
CAGCNSINGKAKVDAAKQTISFSEVGTTLMLCANMEYEEKILKALESVKGYKAAGKGCVDLTDGSDKIVLQLKK